MKYSTTIGEQEFLVEIVDENRLLVNGKLREIDFSRISDQPIYSLLLDGLSYEAYVFSTDGVWQVLLQGQSYPSFVEDELERRLRIASGSRLGERSEFQLKAPMPGLIIDVPIMEGQEVQKGEVLLILESMKMQNELKAPRTGKVIRLHVKTGDNVEQHQTLLSVV